MKKFLLTILSVAAIVSCSDDDKVMGPNSTIVGFTSATQLNSFLNDIPDAEVQVSAGLVSFQDETLPNQDITINWAIVNPTDYLDPADFDDQAAYDAALATFATAGNEFDAPAGGAGTAVLVAGQTLVNLPLITVHPVNFADPNAPKKFVVRLTSASNGAIVGDQYKDVVVTLQGVCNSDLAGDYTLVTTRLDTGTIYNLPGEVITETGFAHYKGNSIGPYNSRGLIGATAQIAGVGLEFDEVCGSIVLWQDPDWQDNGGDTGVEWGTAQYLGPYYNPVYQTDAQKLVSSVDDITGVITIEYNVWFASAPAGRPYRGVYTPL